MTPFKLQKTLLKRYDDTDRLVTVAMHPPRTQRIHRQPARTPGLRNRHRCLQLSLHVLPRRQPPLPHMMFYQSEANHSNMGPNWFEMDLDKVLGLAYWGMIDYLGESNGWPAKGWNQGAFDIALNPKPSAYFLRSFFKPDEPMVHIGIIDSDQNIMWNDVQVGTKRMSDHWNRRDGSKVDLYTYTNADEVELFINGKSQGRRTNNVANNKERNRIFWKNIPYAKGNIEARAYRKGEAKPIATHRIETTGEAKRLKANADNAEWKADGMDLQHIAIQAVDSKNRVVPSANNQLTFAVDGPPKS